MILIGDRMKNKLWIMIMPFLLYAFLLLNAKETVLETFEEVEDYHLYHVHTERENIRTTNFLEIFSSFEIVSIFPYINPLYENKFSKKEYVFQYEEIDKNIEDFTKKYLTTLKNLPYQRDYVTSYIEGIKLVSVKMYANKSMLQNLSKNYPSITYEEIP